MKNFHYQLQLKFANPVKNVRHLSKARDPYTMKNVQYHMKIKPPSPLKNLQPRKNHFGYL